MDDLTNKFSEKMDKTLSVLKEDLGTVRAGRANAAILDKISIDYYGTQSPLKNVSNISVPDPRTLLITPFDPSTVQAIDKAIQEANIGLNPSVDGKNIRLVVPQLTEERRKELTKTTKKMGEEAKVAIRNLRRDANDEAKKKEKNGDYTEDDLKGALDDIQKATDKHIKDIDAMIAKKDKDILEV